MEAIKAGRQIIVAEDNAAEVGLIEGHECLVAGHLQEVCAFLEDAMRSILPYRRKNILMTLYLI
jgi:predicted ATPase with chaperone activity